MADTADTRGVKPLGWGSSSLLFVGFSAIANLIYVTLPVVLASIRLATGNGSPRATLLHDAYVHPGSHEGFMGHYIAAMVGVLGVLVTLNVAVFFGKAFALHRGTAVSGDFAPLVRGTGIVSMAIAAATTPSTAVALWSDFSREGGAYSSLLLVIAPLIWALALFVGKFIVYSDEEKLRTMRRFQEGDRGNRLAEGDSRILPYAAVGALAAVAVLALSHGFSLMLSSAAVERWGWPRAPYVLLGAFALALLLVFFLVAGERDALLAASGSERALTRWMVGATLVALAGLLALILAAGEAGPSQWRGLVVFSVGILCLLLQFGRRGLAWVWAAWTLERRIARREHKIDELERSGIGSRRGAAPRRGASRPGNRSTKRPMRLPRPADVSRTRRGDPR